jgi:hypothetical protein
MRGWLGRTDGGPSFAPGRWRVGSFEGPLWVNAGVALEMDSTVNFRIAGGTQVRRRPEILESLGVHTAFYVIPAIAGT